MLRLQNLRCFLRLGISCQRNYRQQYRVKMISLESADGGDAIKVIEEGKAKIATAGSVFCNPVQEFNRDLSISVLSAFARLYAKEKDQPGKITDGTDVDLPFEEYQFASGVSYENGLYILEALSATGLRSMRYAKEVPGIRTIIANDISHKAVEDIKKNIHSNGVDQLVTASLSDAVMLMHNHKKDQFDAIDLDPYGCPTMFLDSAVQCIKDGGLLLITATDMAVLAGNSPETCYVKYGAVSLKMKSCHEMALRILLQCIESFANRYGRYIVPQLSISADFYIRVFVRVYSGAHKCKFTTSKLSMVYHCTGCGSFELQPLGILKKPSGNAPGNVKFGLPTSPFASSLCEHCKHPYHMGGPIWSAPIHNPYFVHQVLCHTPPYLGTHNRIEGMLSMILEEIHTSPLYYTLERLCGTLHVDMPAMMSIRSAILNAGYKVSFAHCHKNSIKTDAPATVIWGIMRSWAKSHPVSQKWLTQDKVAANLLATPCDIDYSFETRAEANPESRRMSYLRFQQNPTAYWGPGSRAKAMQIGVEIPKCRLLQGKRKRKSSEGASKEDADTVTESQG